MLDLSVCKHLQATDLCHLARWTGLKALLLDVCLFMALVIIIPLPNHTAARSAD